MKEANGLSRPDLRWQPGKAVDPPAPAEAYASLSVGIESEARPTELDVLVIGGGQAGLAIGHQLRARATDLSDPGAPLPSGDSWRRRYDSLVLFTPRSFSVLPGLAVPGDPNAYPYRDEIADYLECSRGSDSRELDHRDSGDVLAELGVFERTKLHNGSRPSEMKPTRIEAHLSVTAGRTGLIDETRPA